MRDWCDTHDHNAYPHVSPLSTRGANRRGMSVFGGDSWAREAQQRKRRVDDLILPDASSASYKKLSNGKYACLLCPNNPILDSPLVISMHNKGSRHIAAETRLNKWELTRRDELNKRLALSDDSAGVSSSATSIQQSKHFTARSKPLIEQTRKAILETQCNNNAERNIATSPLYDSKSLPLSDGTIELFQDMRSGEFHSSEKISTRATEEAGKALADWHAELCKRREKELKFTAAGWKRYCHGKWYRDENVEFDSDEEDPNDSLD